MEPVIIIGGGISGLSAGYFLKKRNIPFLLLEAEDRCGGVIKSEETEHGVCDFGPNSLRDRSGIIPEICSELGFEGDRISISEAFKTRYIVRNKKLNGLKPGLASLFSTDIISAAGKLRILAEPFIPAGGKNHESVGDFLKRRVGSEAVDYLADPVFAGIYAGDVYALDKKAVLKNIAGYEIEYGSLFKGIIKNRKKGSKSEVFSFRRGIQQFVRELSDNLGEHIRHEQVLSISGTKNSYTLKTESSHYHAHQVISTVPAYTLGTLITELDMETTKTLQQIEYPPLLTACVVFNSSEVQTPEDGFGFLVPSTEQMLLLGAIWKSAIFPALSADSKSMFNLMIGGARNPDIREHEIGQITGQALNEFKLLMGIQAEPVSVKTHLWKRAIPQFHVGYQQTLRKLEEFEKAYPGFHIGGNFRWGISVPDCVQGASVLVSSIN